MHHPIIVPLDGSRLAEQALPYAESLLLLANLHCGAQGGMQGGGGWDRMACFRRLS